MLLSYGWFNSLNEYGEILTLLLNRVGLLEEGLLYRDVLRAFKFMSASGSAQ